eukprot:SAG31_NODE_257_length_18942_cov_6.099135_8_plen_96_part_00
MFLPRVRANFRHERRTAVHAVKGEAPLRQQKSGGGIDVVLRVALAAQAIAEAKTVVARVRESPRWKQLGLVRRHRTWREERCGPEVTRVAAPHVV